MTLQSPELKALLEDFNTLTGLRMVLFDEHYQELCCFPSGEDVLCTYLRTNPEFDCKCRECDARAFEEGKKTGKVQIYHCHAGFAEATVPIFRNQQLVGYLIFGQISDEKDRQAFFEKLSKHCKAYGFDNLPANQLSKVKFKSVRQIQAAAKLMEACAGYVILEDMIRGTKPIIERIEQYIDEHLGENLNTDVLCRQFGISRTGLYQTMKPYYSVGVSEAIKQKRLLKAKELIETTDAPISKISETVGFTDYNYFLRCFKSKFGHPSKFYRQ